MDMEFLESTLQRMASRRTPEQVFCSQCGQPQGLGLNGFSACIEHRMVEYKAALAAFDWQFSFSDEYSRWASGSRALDRLSDMQRDLDPTGEVWMSYPGAHGHGAPKPRVFEVAQVIYKGVVQKGVAE